ncbi:Glucan endo-1,3-beta-glucosidase 1 [Spatholobus suberectus]|nr:Glucan endo-1,3-beta-glucosidase 1 [Spatholobus suberectus]
MATFMLKLMLPLLFLSMIPPKTGNRNILALPQKFFILKCTLHVAYAEFEQWGVVDEQTTKSELQAALDWACGRGGADCSKIQVNQPCYLPNTLKDHASYAFNSYYQKFKHSGGSCYFRGAAMTTKVDPRHMHVHMAMSVKKDI